ncbi:GILT-like protein 1 isoform X1 [Sitophilus oryzae]|uniref:GILT-like protein 1 isoform X1 n=2 Tax=Sitophilus oryzae TaxID=7048 RepID=A0A6J2YL04_SITOR|nr:GILT-like protein 1 isoform X1 [Sitophilus oryzae]
MWHILQQIPICFSVLFLCTTLINGQNFVGSTAKLSVKVYFESLCPDSLSFIRNQLYKNWQDIAQYVDLQLIPFGKSASYENGTRFTCQHGTLECKGNRMMSCVLQRTPNQNLQVEYVNCFMNSYRNARIDKDEFGQQCAARIGIDFDDTYKKCYLTRKGTELQLEAERETIDVKLKFVPTIVYNGVFSQQLQDTSLNNFRNVVCDLIKEAFPEACKHTSVISL